MTRKTKSCISFSYNSVKLGGARVGHLSLHYVPPTSCHCHHKHWLTLGGCTGRFQPSGRRKSTEDSPPSSPQPCGWSTSAPLTFHDDNHITCSHLTAREAGKGRPAQQPRPGYNSIPVEKERRALVDSPQYVLQTPKCSRHYDCEVGLGVFLSSSLHRYLDFSEMFILLSGHTNSHGYNLGFWSQTGCKSALLTG